MSAAKKPLRSLFIVGLAALGKHSGDFDFERAADLSHMAADGAAKKKKHAHGEREPKAKIGIEWLREHEGEIVRAINENPFWKNNIIGIEVGQNLALSEFISALQGLHYEKVQTIARPGEYERHGGIVEVWPVNRTERYRIEFYGNAIELIEAIAETKYWNVERQRLLSRRLDMELLDTLKSGDYVVHVDHGIGIFREMGEKKSNENPFLRQAQDKLSSGNNPSAKYFVIEYAKGDRLMVPEDKKDRLSVYIGLRAPEVHRLGSGLWSRTRRAVKASTLVFAKELIQLYARREIEKGYAFGSDDPAQKTFEDA